MNPHDYRFGDTVTATVGVSAEHLNAGDVYRYDGEDLTVVEARRVRTTFGPRIHVEATAENGDTVRGIFLLNARLDLVITDSAL